MTNHCVVDANRQVLRCDHCGLEIARRVAACAAVARETGMTPSYVSKIVRAVAARQKETA